MEHGPFEDVFPIENGDIPASYVSLLEGITNQIIQDACLMTSRFGNSMLVCMWSCITPGLLAKKRCEQWSFRNLMGENGGGCLG